VTAAEDPDAVLEALLQEIESAGREERLEP
jgi:hypothetical protein